MNYIGRLGCHAAGKRYVVAVSYACKDECILVDTYEGMKISMRRDNPEVCFEVENMQSMASW